MTSLLCQLWFLSAFGLFFLPQEVQQARDPLQAATEFLAHLEERFEPTPHQGFTYPVTCGECGDRVRGALGHAQLVLKSPRTGTSGQHWHASFFHQYSAPSTAAFGTTAMEAVRRAALSATKLLTQGTTWTCPKHQ